MAKIKGASNKATKYVMERLTLEDLKPPKRHTPDNRAWTEEEAIEHIEFLIRYYNNDDQTKVFPGQAALMLGYKSAHLFDHLAKKFGGQVAELYQTAKTLQNEKIANFTLNKIYDARFGIFAMVNTSKWRQDNKLDITGHVSIHAKDYKQITAEAVANKQKKGVH
jgi:hypothetical protein